MADFRAIAAVCETVRFVLQDNFDPAEFGGSALQFDIFLASDFAAKKLTEGVSLFMYRVYPNGTNRRPSGRLNADGTRQIPQLPVDLHFLLTAWAQDPSLAHHIVGYMMRIMEDFSILPASLLNSVNAATEAVFHPDESVEVVLAELLNEDLMRLWHDLVQTDYEISVPYVARNIYIESKQPLAQGTPVQQRTVDYRRLPAGIGAANGS
jgi:hypothetical protein